MTIRKIWSVAYLVRPDTCALAFLSIFGPLYYVNGSISFATIRAVPVALILMAGFLINDVHDVEADRVNHPSRALPSALVNPSFAVFAYFFLITISLALVRFYLDATAGFLYVLLLLGLINYNYIVAYAPLLKNIAAAIVFTVPILILEKYLHGLRSQVPIIAALFVTLLGRELLMDILDSKGDGQTFVKRFGAKTTGLVAFALKIGGTCLLLLASSNMLGVVIALALLLTDFVLALVWARGKFRRIAIHIIKVQLAASIYYLI